jgi:hypothetical protein
MGKAAMVLGFPKNLLAQRQAGVVGFDHAASNAEVS